MYGIERIVFFYNFEGLDKTLGLKVLKEFDYDFTSTTFDFPMSVIEAAFLENVMEGNDVAKVFVKLNFGNPAHDVTFKRDVHERVANARGVKKSGQVG